MPDDITPTDGADRFDRVEPSDTELAAASAALDGEGPTPVAPSPGVRRFTDDSLRIRHLLRAGDVAPMPDLAGRVLANVAEDDGRLIPGRGRRRPASWQTVAAVAASFVIGVGVAAALLLNEDFETEPLAAAEFEAEVRGSLAAVTTLDAAVTVIEYGAHPDVPQRTYEGRVRYHSPEQLSLTLTETTRLPPGWPSNDVEVVVDEGIAWRTRRLACPIEAMPGCLAEPAFDGIEGRAPFSAGWAAPLELVVPVESVGAASVARTGESTITALTTVARASTLVATTIDNGAFRQVHADDSIEIRVDADTLTLQGFTIRASAAPARTLWATTWGYADAPGAEILRIDLTADDATGPLPRRPDVGFAHGGFEDGPIAIAGLDDAMPDGFVPHRSGVLTVPGVADTEISGWADGRAWITVRSNAAETTVAPFGATARVVGDHIVIVDDVTHEALILTGTRRIVVSGTLPLDDLVQLAARLPYNGIMPTPPTSGPTSPAIQVGDVVLRVEMRPGRLLPPADRGDIIGVVLRGTTGRFSATVGELTWVENETIVVVSGSTDLDDLLAAAEQVVVR